MEWLTIIISSGIVSALVSAFMNMRAKDREFKQEYFKIVIKKRLDAYEKLEFLIAALKTSSLDTNDAKAYHLPFFNTQDFDEFTKHLMLANAYNLWLNPGMADKLTELNDIFNKLRFEFDSESANELAAAGKKYYNEIATLRVQIETLARKDLLTLYSFKEIEARKAVEGFKEIPISKQLVDKNKNFKQS